jgi:2-polyprenyl-3-methyl-5-hydroxy-6-metoxy-1,4-benzoquinol methylase
MIRDSMTNSAKSSKALLDRDAYPCFSTLTDAVLEQWPEHQQYLSINYAERDPDLLRHSERLSKMIIKLAPTLNGGLPGLASDYRFLCEKIVLPEEIYFRRNNEQYRLQKFSDALATVYSNKEFMTRYMNGLLVSDVIWINHCRCIRHYVEQFLPSLVSGAHLLEIGPGHGLLLCLASEDSRVRVISAWDVSDASISSSRHSIEVLGAEKNIELQKRDIFDPLSATHERFDAVVFSEVLEHMEYPEQAVRALFQFCKPGGKVWINVPANSPAPDHLYLVTELKEAVDLIAGVGFEIVDAVSYPMSGTTLEKAVRQKLTVSCVVIGRRPSV